MDIFWEYTIHNIVFQNRQNGFRCPPAIIYMIQSDTLTVGTQEAKFDTV